MPAPLDQPTLDTPPLAAVSPVPPAPGGRGVKIPAGVVTALMLVLVAGGGWFVWSQLFASNAVDESKYETNDSRSAIARSRFFDPPTTTAASTVTRRPDGTGGFRVPGAFCRFAKSGEAVTVELTYQDTRFVPVDDIRMGGVRAVALAGNASPAAHITTEQINQLKELSPPFAVPASDSDRAKLLDLWARYGNANESEKAGISQSLEAELRRLAAAGIDPTLRAFSEYAAKIRTILKPEQINEFRPQRRVRPPGARQPPATKPAK